MLTQFERHANRRGLNLAAEDVLNYLQATFGMQLWMLTRTDGKDWVVIASADRGYNIQPGDTFQWLDSYCCRMIQGAGPRFAPDTTQVQSYVEAPISELLDIKSYIGVPLYREDGALFGTLCAIDPQPNTNLVSQIQPTVELISSLLNRIICVELRLQKTDRDLFQARLADKVDPTTGLYSRAAWESMLVWEDRKRFELHLPAGVLMFGLEGLPTINEEHGREAGDEYLRRFANTLLQECQEATMVARLTGTQFGIYWSDCPPVRFHAIANRVLRALSWRKFECGIGSQTCLPALGLVAAAKDADLEMYAHRLRIRGQAHAIGEEVAA